MSAKTFRKLSKEKIQQILAAVGSKPTQDAAPPEATDYNWQQPHYFTPRQLRRIDEFTKARAEAIASKFAEFYKSDFEVDITSTTQHFADELLNQPPENKQGSYYLAFDIKKQGPQAKDAEYCGTLHMPRETAVAWAAELLGDTDSEKDPNRNLSPLEESLLTDIASVVVEGFSDHEKNYNFEPAQNVIKEQFPLELKGAEEFCKITFNVKKTGSENGSEAHFLILCNKLEPVTGKTVQTSGQFSADDVSKVILEQLKEVNVTATANLGATLLSFEEIMSLEAGDILLLSKATNEPVDITIENRHFSTAWPAKSAGNYAVVLNELSY